MADFEVKITGANELNIYLKSITKEMKTEIPITLSKIGDYLQARIKSKFGVYQKGWPKLKRASVIAKYRRRASLSGISTTGRKKGSFGIGPDDPLVLFGRLKDSIEKELSTREVSVYSDNPYSAVHEYGYAPKNIPARSYMRNTLEEEEEIIVSLVNVMLNKII